MLSFANFSCVLNETGEKRVSFFKTKPLEKNSVPHPMTKAVISLLKHAREQVKEKALSAKK